MNPGKKVSGFRVRGRVDGAKCNGRSRPSNKKVGGGGGGSKKKFFWGLWSSVWSKNKGGGEWATRAPPLDPPLKCSYMEQCFYV